MARIVQTPALIVLLFDDLVHREIFMDGRSLEPDPNPTWMGYSVGRWEGDTLVVESNGYAERSWLDFDGHPHTEDLRITERYTRRDFGHIDVHVTMVDPKAYLKPIRFSMPMGLQADTELLEFFCDNNDAAANALAATARRAGGGRARRHALAAMSASTTSWTKATAARPSPRSRSTARRCGSTTTARARKR